MTRPTGHQARASTTSAIGIAIALVSIGCSGSGSAASASSASAASSSTSASSSRASTTARGAPSTVGAPSPSTSSSADTVPSGPPPYPLPMPYGSAPNPNHAEFTPDEDVAHHLMTCLSKDAPSACQWWPSKFDAAGLRDLEKQCKEGRQPACLTLGLIAIDKGDQNAAAAKIAPACDARDRLSCVYLAYTHFVCADARKTARALCQWKLELYFSDKEAEDVLEDACARDIPAACTALGDVVFAKYDNRFTYLERGCRFGSIQACASLYDDWATFGVAPRIPADRVERLGYRMLTICGLEPVDCFIAADSLAVATNIPRSSYIFQACDPQHALHMPAEKCR